MRKFLLCVIVFCAAFVSAADDFQLPDPHFEDWSGAAFDGNAQPKYWHGSNVSQSALGMTFNFNFTHKETGRSGSCVMVQDQEVGAAGITEVGPGYFSLGYGWQHLEGLNTGSATAGTYGGHAFKHRPDTVSVWIKRTGSNTAKEDFHILFYSWSGTAKGESYKNKNGGCTSTTREDEESDVRIALDANECKTVTPGHQVAEGWLRDRKEYNDWVNVRVPILYLNSDAPEKCNLIFSASNYPNYRANSGLYEGNSLYVDDVELIYSSKIQKLFINDKEWKGFDPNSTEVQYFSLGEGASFPTIEARRGAGSLTNVEGQSTTKTQNFPGRVLSGSEISITKGDLKSTPTKIVVKSEDGKSTMTYLIQFQEAASSNAKLASVAYTYKDKSGKDQTVAVPGFSPSKYNYTIDLPYGTTSAPKLSAEKQEDDQQMVITDATSATGSASIAVTAANGSTKATYTFTFRIAELADNTLKDIKVNGNSVLGFTPSQTVYKVSLPTSTQTLKVEPVSEYPAGAQTIVITPATMPTGDAISGTTVQISVTTPGNKIAKVYKLNIKLEASSYSYLSALWLVGDQVQKVSPSAEDPKVFAFSPDQLTYYVNLKMGSTSLPTIKYTQGDEYQKVAVSDLGAGVVDGTVRVTVTAGNGDQSVYKLVFSTEKSEISTLAGIKIGGVMLEDFASDKLNYTYALPVGTTELPAIEPVASDEFQKIVVTTAGVTGKTRITVTAGNGNTTIYQITFSVATFSDNTLKSLTVTGYELLNASGEATPFEAETNEYWVNIPKGVTTLPAVSYELQNPSFQTASERLPSGVNGDYKITVRPSSGASRTYIIHFSQDKSSNTALSAIYLDGVLLSGFRADSLHYIDSLKPGDSRIPNVTFTKSEASQRVLSVLENKTQVITVTAESGATRVYTIDFIVQMSENAFLDMIYVDSLPLEGFRKDSLEYIYYLTGTRCPVITVDKAAGQQVTITAPYAAGEAKIKVQPESGSANTYTIQFKAVATATVQLSDIRINGESISGFSATKTDYTATYSGELPTVEGVKKEESQTVNVLWKNNVASLHVTDAQGVKAVYTVTFTRQMAAKVTLEGIYADGVLIKYFNPETFDYSYSLKEGSDYPEITYKAADETQVVFFGQQSEGKWGITVVAENGKDTAHYTVQYTVKAYKDAKLANLEVEGYTIDFADNQMLYSGLKIDEGVALPRVIATPKKGQSVIIYNEDDKTQKVRVMAESGAENTYIISYTRVKSGNVSLADLLVAGKQIPGFRPDSLDYIYSLPRDAKAVPNVNPVAQLDNQTITTCFSRPDGVTTIKVEAQNGASREYTIAFPKEKSANTKLKSLTINAETKNVDTTEYEFHVPFGTIEPFDVDYETEDGQLVRFIDAPITGVTRIIVTSETGDTRTYSIRYVIDEPKGENKIKLVKYSYIDAADATVNKEIVPVPGDNIISLPFGAKSFEVTEVEKTFADQTTLLYNGGIRRGAKIIAVANRQGEDDVVYTLTPETPAFDTIGKLSELKFKGNLVPNWRPDVYNYMINVTEEPVAADFSFVKYNPTDNVSTSEIKQKEKQITFKVDGGETYSVCWFYSEDESMFTFDWIKTDKAHWYEVTTLGGIFGTVAKEKEIVDATGYKPKGWSVPADFVAYIDYDASVSHFTYYTGKEVTRISDKEVILSTIRGGALNSSMPGTMTLGSLSLPDGVRLNGGTKISFQKDVTKGVTYRNTPEKFEFDYQPIMATRINAWNAWVALGGADDKKVEYTMSGDYSGLAEWKTATQALTYDFTVQQFNILLCASEISESSLNIYGGPDSYSSDLQIKDLRFVYNSELTAVTVNGQATVKEGNVFTYNVPANTEVLGEPALKFEGAVHDQMQTIEWLNEGEWLNGELKALVINYGENSLDTTHYLVVLKREAVTTRDYTATYGSFDETQRNDTVFIHMPFGHKQLPDFNIEPASIHQRFDVTKKGNAITVKVTDEAGNDSTTVYLFQETKNNIAALSGITAEDSKEVAVPVTPTFDGDVLEYTVTAAEMPIFSYTKTLTAKDETMGQTVDITYTADSATLLVTAGDGVTTRKYVIYRNDPTVTTKGQIKEFNKGGEPWAELGGETYSANGAKTDELITFERVDATDSVVYIQSPTQMEWKVFGTENHSYVLHYPTDQSTNANLANILIGGQPYADFLATTLEYDIESDTMLIIEAVEAEAVQRLTLAQKMEDGVVVYEDTVRAESGAMQVYKIRVSRPKSTVNTLSGIMLDSVLIEGFDPNTFDYTVELPVPAVKTEQPKMPSLTYLAGQKGQTIRMKTGEMNGDATELVVTSEAGVDNTYFVTVKAAKSSCVDLSGILVNGVAIEQFEAGRHFYSQSLKTNAIAIDYTSDDRFQTVNISSQTIKPELQYEYTLEVVAENGAKANYEVMIYVENQSNDAQLANILLDGKDFVNFERALNADLVFDGGNNSYVINLPSGTTIWPEVSAQLKMDGQSVAIDRRNDSVLLDVTAMDGITHNVYALRFAVPKSTNTELSMIFLNGAELEGFRPDKYFYVIALAEGEHEMPEVVPQKSESAQICDTVWDRKNQQVTIPVTAEDASVNAAYNIVFQFTQSAADTLLAIYADGVKIAGFDPHKLHYTDSLAVGTVAFPDLSWEEVNEWQTIRLDTVSMSPDSSQLVRSITVTAENGYSNTYIVSYVIRKSEVNTLQMLIIDQKELSGFVPTKEEYYYTLTAAEATELNGALPKVEFIEGDEYQSVFVAQALDSLSGKSLGYKSVVTVTAASGSSRTYTIHYPVEMSSDATLNMVMLGGKPLSNYDAERFTYKVEIEMGDAIPVVSVIKKEDAQTYEIRVEDDTVRIDVWAENTDYTQTYTLSFERLLSAVTTLHDIILRDADSVRFTMAQFPFRSDEYTYSNIEIPYSADSDPKDLLPSMEFVLADSLQTVDTVLHMLPNGDIQVEVKVTAANGEDEAAYSLTFHFLKPSDAKLTAILVNGELIEDFRPDVTDYTIMHPYGTAPEDYVTIDSISYVLSDSLAVDTIYMSEDSIIYIVITAQDGTTEMTYMISQKTAPDGDNALAWITVDDAELREFEPETTFYTYYLLPGGAAPAVDAGARSENAEVSVREASAGDTCMIICTAADGKERRYYIHFAFTEVDPGVNATGNDVLVKRVPGSMQIMAATVRQGVTFALYDRHGQLVLYERVPVANPNDADVVIGSDNAEHLNNVIDTRSGLLIELIPGEPYFYSFFLNEKTNLGGGKIMGF